MSWEYIGLELVELICSCQDYYQSLVSIRFCLFTVNLDSVMHPFLKINITLFDLKALPYVIVPSTIHVMCWGEIGLLCVPCQYISNQLLCQAPVPLSIFRSNSKFDENSECSGFEYTRPITTIFCTRQDSDTVVTCAKYRCDRPRIFYTRVFWIFIEFRIRSKYA